MRAKLAKDQGAFEPPDRKGRLKTSWFSPTLKAMEDGKESAAEAEAAVPQSPLWGGQRSCPWLCHGWRQLLGAQALEDSQWPKIYGEEGPGDLVEPQPAPPRMWHHRYHGL